MTFVLLFVKQNPSSIVYSMIVPIVVEVEFKVAYCMGERDGHKTAEKKQLLYFRVEWSKIGLTRTLVCSCINKYESNKIILFL